MNTTKIQNKIITDTKISDTQFRQLVNNLMISQQEDYIKNVIQPDFSFELKEKKKQLPKGTIQNWIKKWNECAESMKFPPIMTSSRTTRIISKLIHRDGDKWDLFFENLPYNTFLQGKNWFDLLWISKNMGRPDTIINRKYEDFAKNKQNSLANPSSILKEQKQTVCRLKGQQMPSFLDAYLDTDNYTDIQINRLEQFRDNHRLITVKDDTYVMTGTPSDDQIITIAVLNGILDNGGLSLVTTEKGTPIIDNDKEYMKAKKLNKITYIKRS